MKFYGILSIVILAACLTSAYAGNLIEYQSIPTNGATDWEFFTIGRPNITWLWQTTEMVPILM